MSENHKANKGAPDKFSPESEHIARAIRELLGRISHALIVKYEASVEDNERYAEERANRQLQLRTAKALNYITTVSGLIALLALVFVYLQYKQSREAFEAGQRAWVLIVKTVIIDDSKPLPTKIDDIPASPIIAGTKQTVLLGFKNTGPSPALNVHMHVQSSLNGGACQSAPTKSPYESTIVIAPGQISTNINTYFVFNETCVNGLHDGSANYAINGTIRYDDIFGHARDTTFCLQYEGTTTRTMSACKEGNQAR